MITDLHFIRPLWFLALIPLVILGVSLWKKKHRLQAWDEICDQHLLEKLTQKREGKSHSPILLSILLSAFFFILSLTGPSWNRLPVPSYQAIQPRVIVMDLSDSMLEKDLSPDRLSRAKFKLDDLFKRSGSGQWGLVVYTGEPFVVSPLTEDGETIANLLPTLTPDIMPVAGQSLESALEQAADLIKQAGFKQGQILVLSSEPPSSQAIAQARRLANENMKSSIMPVLKSEEYNPLFERFAKAGEGLLLPLTADSSDLDQWLSFNQSSKKYALSKDNDLPLWQDEGRWFLIPALLFFLPLFRRGWLQGISA